MALYCGGKHPRPPSFSQCSELIDAKIFPSRLREFGTSLGVSTQWLFNFTFSLTTPYMIKAWGSYVFIFYALLDLTMATLVFVFLKETQGRSLEEMETVFNSKAAFDVQEVRKRVLEDENIDVFEVVDVRGGKLHHGERRES